jgi:hypothetical protein
MIGNTLGQFADADKLSADQLKESIQNGTIPAYIGIPLMQQKIADKKRMEQAQAQPPTSPPIAQQVMQEANSVVNPQIPMYQEGVNNLPSNLPATGMNGGGIVSLAEGGDLMDPYDLIDETQQEESDYMSALNDLTSMASQIGMMSAPDKRTMPKLNTTPDVEQDQILQQAPQQRPQQPQPQPQQQSQPQAQQQPQQRPQGGGLDDLISGAADRYNMPPELLRNVAGAESSGRPNAQNPNSSAKGVYQFIDSTWESLGGTPGGQFNPEENVDLGAKYLRQNAEALKKSLGRDPSYSEVYAAHYFGPCVAKMLANASPEDSIDQGLRTFNSPATAQRILKANPNLRGKTVGEVLASLEGKAGSGIVQLARGGAISLAEGGDFTDQYGNFSQPPANSSTTPLGRFLGSNAEGYQVEQPPERSFYDSMMDSFRASPIGGFMSQTDEERKAAQDRMNEASSIKLRTPEEVQAGEKSKQSNINIPTAKESPKVTAPVVTGKTPEQKAQEEKALKDSNIETPNVDQKKPTAKASTEKTLYDQFQEDYKNSKSDRERQKKMDAYMALATAGFAMAGGSSPNALQNISQGALAGIAQYGGASKARQAAQSDDMKNLLTAQRYQELGEAARATQSMADSRLTQEERVRSQTLLNAREKEFQDAVQKDTALIGVEGGASKAIEQLRLTDPSYNQLFKQAYGVSYRDYLTQQSGKQPVTGAPSTTGFKLIK